MEEENNNIKILVEEATRNAEQIRASVDIVKGYLSELETTKQEIRTKQTSTKALATNVENRSTTADTTYKTIVDLEQKAQGLVAMIDTEHKKLVAYLAQFNATRTKLDDTENGLDATYEWAEEQKEEIEKIFEQVKADQGVTAEMVTVSQKNAGIVEQHKKDVEGYRIDIENIYGFINGQGLAHSFSKRQDELKWPLIIWSGVLFVSAVLVSWSLYSVFKELPKDTATGMKIFDPTTLLYRISFISPILLIFFVALRQYSRERRLLESYAFKAATAKALESYTEILARRFPEEEFRDRILAFVLHAMVGIYRHPNNELNKVEDDEKSWVENITESVDKIIHPVKDNVQNVLEKNIPTPK